MIKNIIAQKDRISETLGRVCGVLALGAGLITAMGLVHILFRVGWMVLCFILTRDPGFFRWEYLAW